MEQRTDGNAFHHITNNARLAARGNNGVDTRTAKPRQRPAIWYSCRQFRGLKRYHRQSRAVRHQCRTHL